jgi:hypothetical protein
VELPSCCHFGAWNSVVDLRFSENLVTRGVTNGSSGSTKDAESLTTEATVSLSLRTLSHAGSD